MANVEKFSVRWWQDSPLLLFSCSRLSRRLCNDKKISWRIKKNDSVFSEENVNVGPSALIIVVHQAPPLLLAGVLGRGPDRLVWIELLVIKSWTLGCAAGLGKFQPRHGTPRTADETAEVTGSVPVSGLFLCPPTGICPAPLLEGVMALLSDLPKSEAVASLLVQDCRDPLTSHYSVMFRAAFAFVKIIIGTKGNQGQS